MEEEYKWICVFCGTETNDDHCSVCKSFEGLLTPEEIEEIDGWGKAASES